MTQVGKENGKKTISFGGEKHINLQNLRNNIHTVVYISTRMESYKINTL